MISQVTQLLLWQYGFFPFVAIGRPLLFPWVLYLKNTHNLHYYITYVTNVLPSLIGYEDPNHQSLTFPKSPQIFKAKKKKRWSALWFLESLALCVCKVLDCVCFKIHLVLWRVLLWFHECSARFHCCFLFCSVLLRLCSIFKSPFHIQAPKLFYCPSVAV